MTVWRVDRSELVADINVVVVISRWCDRLKRLVLG